MVIVDYDDTDRYAAAAVNRDDLGAFGNRIGAQVQRLAWPSFETSGVLRWNALTQLVIEEVARRGRAITLIVDLAGIPRIATLGLLGWGAASGMIASIDYLYSTALSYRPRQAEGGDPVFPFHKGSWRPMSVPGLGSPVRTGAANHVVVCAGFEGRQLRRLVSLLEPETFSLVGVSGVSVENDARLTAELAHFVGLARLRPSKPVLVDGNSLEAIVRELHALLDEIESNGRERERAVDVSVVLGGPKMLSLAWAIVSLSRTISNVFYVAPDSHDEVEIESLGHSLQVTVEIED